jgi:hypothetical protein
MTGVYPPKICNTTIEEDAESEPEGAGEVASEDIRQPVFSFQNS